MILHKIVYFPLSNALNSKENVTSCSLKLDLSLKFLLFLKKNIDRYGRIPKLRLFLPKHLFQEEKINLYCTWYENVEEDIIELYENILLDYGYKIHSIYPSEIYSIFGKTIQDFHKSYYRFEKYIDQIYVRNDAFNSKYEHIRLIPNTSFLIIKSTNENAEYFNDSNEIFENVVLKNSKTLIKKLFTTAIKNLEDMLGVSYKYPFQFNVSYIKEFIDEPKFNLKNCNPNKEINPVSVRGCNITPESSSYRFNIEIDPRYLKENEILRKFIFLIVAFQIPVCIPWNLGMGCFKFHQQIFKLLK